MKKDNICPDGFPQENDLDNVQGCYNCDNCGKQCDFSGHDNRVDAIGDGEQAELHLYGFCSHECVEEFARDNNLEFVKTTDEDKEDGVYTEYTFHLKTSDPVADAVKSIMTDEPTADEPDAAAEPTNEQPALVDDVHERKAAECLKEVVKRAMEISDLSSKIADEKEYLKGLQKEYDTLVKRQQEYILENANGIQLTFSDCDPATPTDNKSEAEKAEAGQPSDDPNAVAVDTMGWRSLPCDTQLPIKLTDKQWGAVKAAFPTLGALQDWLCQDKRDKIPGVSQTV